MLHPLKFQIPGIKQILAIRPIDIPADVLHRAEVGLPTTIFGKALEVPFVGVPTCEVVEKRNKSGASFETKLKFISQEDIPELHPICWVVTDNDGRSTLLGCQSGPYPRETRTDSTGEFSSRKGVSHEIICITRPAECVVACKIC